MIKISPRTWETLENDAKNILKTNMEYAVSFLSLFEENLSDIIVCSMVSKGGQGIQVKYSDLSTALNNNDKYECDVYFHVNGGGTKQAKINKIRASFIDIDVGRDKNGNYLQNNIVKKRKEDIKYYITNCAAPPSIISETRNGYHCYWLFDNTLDGHSPMDLEKWREIQQSLLKYFEPVGGDRMALKINQLLRVPGTMWKKKWTGLPNTSVVYVCTGNKYTIDSLHASLIPAPVKKMNWGSPSDLTAKKTVNTGTSTTVSNTVLGTVMETMNFLAFVAYQAKLENKYFLLQTAERLAKELAFHHNLSVVIPKV